MVHYDRKNEYAEEGNGMPIIHKQFRLLLLCLILIGMQLSCAASEPAKSGEISKENLMDQQTEAVAMEPSILALGSAAVTVDVSEKGLSQAVEESDTLFGLFLEDINFAVDGGLYAELVKNRSFEYGQYAVNEHKHGWLVTDSDTVTFEIRDGSKDGTALNPNNPTYAVITNAGADFAGIANVGFLDGMAVEGGKEYVASLYIKSTDVQQAELALVGKDKTVYAAAAVSGITDSWQKLSVTLSPTETVTKGLRLQVSIPKGTVCLDMVSLMPTDTFMGLPIRKDLGEALQALNPSFLRFPGGCIIEGRDLESMYSWKDSIGNGETYTINGTPATGDVSSRPQGVDLWHRDNRYPYYMTYGLGFYEYFCLCEKLNCLPLPVLNAGMTCQLQSPRYTVFDTDSPEFRQCVQDALDLVEFCRGGVDTQWGAVRAAMGHEAPFDLKYIGIGNEQWQREYFDHYLLFLEAFDAAEQQRPELFSGIELILANGTTSSSHEGWDFLRQHGGQRDTRTGLVDEHFYNTTDWFLSNTRRYDGYDRNWQDKVFVGEYASWTNTLRSALAEAAFMTGIERNADVVKMACYAPLLCSLTSSQWTPDMIFYNNHAIVKSVNYYVQQLFAQHVGKLSLPTTVEHRRLPEDTALCGGIGLGSWETSVIFDNLKVVSNEDGRVLYENDFSEDTLASDGWQMHQGDWQVADGTLQQTDIGYPNDPNTGDAIFIGDTSWKNYTLTVDATIDEGLEGFLIPICVHDAKNLIFWNIGGWGNVKSCLQIVSDGMKGNEVAGTEKSLHLEQGKVYHLKVEVLEDTILCYINDKLYVHYLWLPVDDVYAIGSLAKNGDLVVKLVNNGSEDIDVSLRLPGFDAAAYASKAKVYTLCGQSLLDANTPENPDLLVPVESTLSIGEQTSTTLPHYSLTIITVAKN